MLDTAYTEVERPIREDYPCEVVRSSAAPRNHYYRVGGIEVIDYIKAKLTPEQYKGYLLGNIYKYSGRCQYKGEYQKDVKKLAEYIKWLKELDGSNDTFGKA